jgi:hypothetical protein
MFMKLLLLNGAKIMIGGSIGVLLLAVSPLGLPLGSTWFDGFMWGVGVYVILGAAVSSMVEPDEQSSKAYVFVFRFGHVLLNRATIYFTHRSFWRIFVKDSESTQRPQD